MPVLYLITLNPTQRLATHCGIRNTQAQKRKKPKPQENPSPNPLVGFANPPTIIPPSPHVYYLFDGFLLLLGRLGATSSPSTQWFFSS
jgi:hypothetical protein